MVSCIGSCHHIQDERRYEGAMGQARCTKVVVLVIAELEYKAFRLDNETFCSIDDHHIYHSLFAARSPAHIRLTSSAKEIIPKYQGEDYRKYFVAADASILATIASTMVSRKLVNNLAQLGCRTSRDLFARSVPCYAAQNAGQRSNMATVASPVTQSSMGSKGPTAMVFMNMGGPSTTDQVGSFLSRLFVSPTRQCSPHMLTAVILGRW
jgi:hypothetical protein